MKGVEQIARLYDAVVKPLNRFGLGDLRQELVGALSGDILEIGVGTGLNLSYYGPDARVTAIDIDAGLLEAAGPRAGLRGYRLQQADAQMLPFPDASFSAVVSTLVFCSIPVPGLALSEIRRVLRPGGKLLQLEHTRTGRPWIDAGLDAITPVWKRIAGGCHPNRDTTALLEANGWEIERHDRRGGGLIRLLVSTPSQGQVDTPNPRLIGR